MFSFLATGALVILTVWFVFYIFGKRRVNKINKRLEAKNPEKPLDT